MQSERRKEIYAWAMYDWANSAFATTVMAGFFPLFFKGYYSAQTDATVTTAQLGFANALASLVIVVLAPLLGAVADAAGSKKRFLFLFAYLGIVMTASLALVEKGAWETAVFCYVMANIGFMGSNTFYDALLPSVCGSERRDRVSGLGFALGYLGGGILFALNVWMVTSPSLFGLNDAEEAVRWAFGSVAVWWALFSLPLLLFVKEKRRDQAGSFCKTLSLGYTRLRTTVCRIASIREITLFLCAYWLYIDGVDTIIRMAVDYGMALGFSSDDLILALLLVQFVGFPATLLFARLAERWDTKNALLSAIIIYLFITLWASVMDSVAEFYLLAVMIALVQGGVQALSRSYYSRMIPVDASAEFFGFYNLMGKFAAVLGPLMVGGVALLSGSSRLGIASVALLFIAGGILLWRVDAAKGAEQSASLFAR